MKIAASTQKYKSSPTKASQLWSWMALKNRAFHWLSSTSMATRPSSMAITLPSRTRPAQRSSERKYGKARPQMVPSVVKKPLTGCSCRVDRVCRGLLIRISRAELRHHGQVTPQASSRSPSESEGVRDPERHATAEARKSRPESPAVTGLRCAARPSIRATRKLVLSECAKKRGRVAAAPHRNSSERPSVIHAAARHPRRGRLVLGQLRHHRLGGDQ